MHDVCGIGAYGIDGTALAGTARYHHDAPVYAISKPDRFVQDSVSFNVVIAPDDRLPPAAGFAEVGCWANGFNEATLNKRMPHICVLRHAREPAGPELLTIRTRDQLFQAGSSLRSAAWPGLLHRSPGRGQKTNPR